MHNKVEEYLRAFEVMFRLVTKEKSKFIKKDDGEVISLELYLYSKDPYQSLEFLVTVKTRENNIVSHLYMDMKLSSIIGALEEYLKKDSKHGDSILYMKESGRGETLFSTFNFDSFNSFRNFFHNCVVKQL